jgi:hypothetical protein
MVEYDRGVIDVIKTLKQLQTLVIDLDQQKHGHELIFSIIKEMPRLQHLGRLGRVDRQFWRIFPKQSCTHLRWIEIGSLKFPIASRLSPNPLFLEDLPFGVLWAFPNITRVSIHLGFQGGIDTDLMLNIVKQLKEGLPGDFRKRTLKRINIFQMSDVDLLRPIQWNYVCNTFAGGDPIDIFVTDDSSEDGITGKWFRQFGPHAYDRKR